MEKLLCPSMMCADYGRLKEEVQALDRAGVDIFHCDVMDGSFVPNMTMGIMDIRTIRRFTQKPIDVHLMVENPGEKVDWFLDAGANLVYIHPESERYVVKTLAHIKERGAAAGIAINPDTSVASISELLARRLPPCSPVQEHSPTAYRRSMLEQAFRSTLMPPHI